MAAPQQRGTTPTSCVTFIGMPAQNAANVLKLLVFNPHSTLSHIVQHIADWVSPLPRSHHSPPPTLKFFHTLPSPSPSPSLLYGQSSSSATLLWRKRSWGTFDCMYRLRENTKELYLPTEIHHWDKWSHEWSSIYKSKNLIVIDSSKHHQTDSIHQQLCFIQYSYIK